MHPVIRRLISVKWRIFGKLGGIGALLLNLLYATLWTVLAVTIPTKDKDAYLPLPEKVWRWIIAVLIAVLTIYEIVQQVSGVHEWLPYYLYLSIINVHIHFILHALENTFSSLEIFSAKLNNNQSHVSPNIL